MLTYLTATNLVLMERCDIVFHENFTTITGETGAGKTALLHALKLLLGGKLGTSYIRSGETSGKVCGTFFTSSKTIQSLLQEMDISHEEDTLALSREISSEGRSKSFINGRPVPLSFLQRISSHLLQIVDQSSYHELKKGDTTRNLLDTYGSLEKKRDEVSSSFSKVEEVKKEHLLLLKRAEGKERKVPFLLSEIEELRASILSEEDEEALFQEYSIASNSQELLETSEKISSLLQADEHSPLKTLATCKALASPLLKTHDLFKEVQGLFDEATCSLQEVENLLSKAFSLFDLDPEKIENLEKTLSMIDKAKRKHGLSLQERKDKLEVLEEELSLLEQVEMDLIEGEKRLSALQEDLKARAKDLSVKRKCFAKELEKKLSNELQELNMEGAKVVIEVLEQPLSSSGQDSVSLFLQANQGEDLTEAKQTSSGGELSRLLLSFKLHLAEKNNTPTLIFDEIDANVGGTTARLVGEKLKELSKTRQVICITHFPQVACLGDLHLKVEKSIENERTLTRVRSLSKKEQGAELLRMLGGDDSLTTHLKKMS